MPYNSTKTGRNNDPIKQSIQNDLPFNSTKTQRNNDYIKESIQNDLYHSSVKTERNIDPIKQSILNESNFEVKPRSNPIRNNSPINEFNARQGTRLESTRYDRSRTGINTPNIYNQGKSHESVSLPNARTQTLNYNSKENNAVRSSNERGIIR